MTAPHDPWWDGGDRTPAPDPAEPVLDAPEAPPSAGDRAADDRAADDRATGGPAAAGPEQADQQAAGDGPDAAAGPPVAPTLDEPAAPDPAPVDPAPVDPAPVDPAADPASSAPAPAAGEGAPAGSYAAPAPVAPAPEAPDAAEPVLAASSVADRTAGDETATDQTATDQTAADLAPADVTVAAPAPSDPTTAAPAPSDATAAEHGLPSPAGAPTPAPGHDRPSEAAPALARSRRDLVALVAALVVVSLLAAGVALLGLRLRDAQRTETAREQAVAASRDAARLLFSYDHSTLEADFARGLAVTTGEFREEYTKTTRDVVADVAKEYKAVVLADVVESAVVDAEPDRVTTIVFLNQATTSTRVEGQQVDASRVLMTLVERDGRWLVSKGEAL